MDYFIGLNALCVFFYWVKIGDAHWCNGVCCGLYGNVEWHVFYNYIAGIESQGARNVDAHLANDAIKVHDEMFLHRVHVERNVNTIDKHKDEVGWNVVLFQ